MSAPPMASTMCTPNNNASASMMSSGVSPSAVEGAAVNATPSQMAAASSAAFSQWRAGNSSGALVMMPCNLPNALTEPVKVTAPMSTPR